MENTKTGSMISRRGFMEGMAASSVAVAALSGVKAAAQSSRTTELKCDVVVMGTGVAGLTSAIRAQKAGAKVIVCETAWEPGGTTAHSEGFVANNRFEDMRTRCPEGDPVVQKVMADNVTKWGVFMDSLGAPLGGKPVEYTGRSFAPVAWINFITAVLESGGAKILCETPVIKLLQNAQGEIVGVLCDSPKGLIRISAKAVVIAGSGWMNNGQMVMANITRYFGMLRQRNASYWDRKPPFMGDGLFMVLAIGGQPSAGGWDGFYGHMLPARPGRITNPMANWSAYFSPYAVAVNRFGKRYCDEGLGRMVGRRDATPAEQNCVQETARQPDAMAAYVFDQAVYKENACENCGLGSIDKYVAYKMSGAPTAMANSIPELAKQMEAWNVGMSADNLLHDITEYNIAAANGKTWALPIPKTVARQARPLENPPYYAILGQAGITSVHGGIRVDGNAQVVHRSGKPIPGLYAAGNAVGNFNNIHYNGNITMGAGLGYVAGENAAKTPVPKGGMAVSADD